MLKWSFPYARIILTRHAKPNLASQAANVRITNKINNSISELCNKYISAKVKIIPSRANKLINKCRRWITNVIIEAIVINLTAAEPNTNITQGINSTFGLQDQRSSWASQVQKTD